MTALDVHPFAPPQPTPPAKPRRRLPSAPRLSLSVRSRDELAGAPLYVLWVCTVFGGLAIWLLVFGLGLSGLSEQHQQESLYEAFRSQLNQVTAPLGGTIARGAPVAILQSAAGGLDHEVVVEGSSSAQLRSGPGHLPGTPLPGQAGDSMILGRGVTYGAPFGHLGSLRVGDAITVTTGQGVFTYHVTDVRHAGQPEPPALTGTQGRITLVSTQGVGWQAGWIPSRVVYADALLVGSTQAAPADTAAATRADGVMRSDDTGLYQLLLWIQLLVLATVGIVWARYKWGHWQAWVVGVPIVLTALWGASGQLWSLFPNLL